MVNRRGFLAFAGVAVPAFSQSSNAPVSAAPGSPWALAWETLDKGIRDGDPEHRKDAPGLVQGAVRDAKKKLHKPSELAVMGLKEGTGAVLGPGSLGLRFGLLAMKDGGAPGRVAAVGILAKDDDPYALTLLEWAMTDKSDKSGAVRAAIAKALGTRGNEQTIPKLVPSLSDDRNLVRVMSAASIVKLTVRH